MQLPDEFSRMMRQQLGDREFSLFLEALNLTSPASIRLHPLKCKTVGQFPTVPWCPNGRYLPSRPVYTLDPAFHAGTYYVQEASSMVIWDILDQVLTDKSNLRILDLCAAPGGKTTLLADYFQEKSLIVANEIHRGRVQILRDNVIKAGYANVVVSHNTPREIGKLTGFFDIILVDAPCSGEGMFRKDPDACNEWSPAAVDACANRQEEILTDILPALKNEGVLLFSTCTYNATENEGSMSYLAEMKELQNIELSLTDTYNVTSRRIDKAIGYQFYPHIQQGEGFFVTVFKKTEADKKVSLPKTSKNLTVADRKQKQILEDNWCKTGATVFLHDNGGNTHLLMKEFSEDVIGLSNNLKLLHCGVNTGSFQRDIFLPHHNLALSHWASEMLPMIEIEKTEALSYLKKLPPTISSDLKGWHLVSYKGPCLPLDKQVDVDGQNARHTIGWAKNIGSRWNNYLPSEYRIRMEIQK